MFGRVEHRDTECAEIVPFVNANAMLHWEVAPYYSPFPEMQDPCVTVIDGQMVLGGVRFPVRLSDGTTGWRMEFFRGDSSGNLRHFFTGPEKMKDIRIRQMADGRIAVFTRPQGQIGGRGKIGFCIVDSLEALIQEDLERAPLFEHLFLDSEWGGANEIHLLDGGLLGVLGHIACFDPEGNRHYYPMVFRVDPVTGKAGPLRIIAERSDFPPCPAKRSDLQDVIFSGGLIRQGNRRATLYAGLSDAVAARLELEDPFLGEW